MTMTDCVKNMLVMAMAIDRYISRSYVIYNAYRYVYPLSCIATPTVLYTVHGANTPLNYGREAAVEHAVGT